MEDPQIAQLKELVRQNTAITQETNQMVKSMRNASRMGRVMKIVWIGLIAFASISAYFYFQPYIAQIMDFYNQAQATINQAKQLGSQFGGQSN